MRLDNALGHLSIVLHAHLPYVRHPEYDTFLEEMWLFEAMTETYLPLARMVERLEDDGVDFALLLSLSPPLVCMMRDPLLQERYIKHLHKLIRLADSEIRRTAGDVKLNRLARWYADFFRDTLFWYEEKYGRDLAGAFRQLASLGHLDLMTCAGTHGFLPLLSENPPTVVAQVKSAVAYHKQVFGVEPAGIWVPECAFYPGLDDVLADAGIRYFLMDTPGFENASDKPKFGVYAPIQTPSGVAVFGRDKETSYQVWAAECGYPGHASYREFYRDAGFMLDEKDVSEFLIAGHIRVNTGLKYCRITRDPKDGERKEPYDLDLARQTVQQHVDDFVHSRVRQIERLRHGMDRKPLIVSPYDAELFGHWWFEGPQFLEGVFRKMHDEKLPVQAITPREYLLKNPVNQVAIPAGCSWGHQSTYEYWLNELTDELYRDLHRAAEELIRHVDTRLDGATALQMRLLKQMARELMLAQSSDWPFIIKTGTSPDYARSRVKGHLARFWILDEALRSGQIDVDRLQAIEYMDTIFPDLNLEWFRSEPAPVAADGGTAAMPEQ